MRILREAIGMRERGHTLILGVMQGGALIQKAREQGFIVYELNFHKTRWPLLFFQLLQIFTRHSITLVNTHSSLDSWIGGIAAKAAHIPIVRTRHLSSPIRPGWNSRLLYGTLADFIVTTCSSILPKIIEQSGRPKDSGRSIPTGVDLQKTQSSLIERAEFRQQFSLRPDDLLIGTACFMRSWKGLHDLLQSAHLLRHKTNIHWLFIGGGHEAEYRARAQELQLSATVHFTGHLENPFPALGALDIFTLLSTAHEGVSQAILQAAYLEKPLIATPTGGLKDVCLHELTGLQVAPFSPHQVVQAVLRLQEEPSLRTQFGQAARRRVEKEFTFQTTLDAMEEVYTRFH